MRNKKAFTLIELLVVIAIIAILAAILFPVFAAAREKARQTMCASNQKQLALAMMQYVNDNDEMFPGLVTYGNMPTFGFGGAWGAQIFPYVKSVDVFRCPSSPDSGPDYTMNGFLGCGEISTSLSGPNQANGAVERSVTWCSTHTNYTTNYISDEPGLSISKVALPTATWLYWESYQLGDTWGTCKTDNGGLPGAPGTVGPCSDVYSVDASNYYYFGLGNTQPTYCPTTAGGSPFAKCFAGDANWASQIWHHGMNIAYTDGHVKFMTQAQLRALGTTTPFAGYENGAPAPGGWHSNGFSDQEPMQ